MILYVINPMHTFYDILALGSEHEISNLADRCGEQVVGHKYGVSCVVVDTISDIYEAVNVVKELNGGDDERE